VGSRAPQREFGVQSSELQHGHIDMKYRSDFAFCLYAVYGQLLLLGCDERICASAVKLFLLLCACLGLLLVMWVNQLFYLGVLEQHVFALSVIYDVLC
jgi:hypothetical protein